MFERATRSAVELVELVSPVADVTISAAGDAAVAAAPGVVARELAALLLKALEHASEATSFELVIRVDGKEALAAGAGAGELRLPLA